MKSNLCMVILSIHQAQYELSILSKKTSK